ncbi:hypothetical protein GID16_22335 [Salmonella enterica]|nr:hypothetical protein [Salmonella enterica]
MTTITKEWLQQTIAEFENTRDDIPFGLSDDDAKILIVLKRALASLTAEPVRYLNKFSGTCVTLEQQPNASDDVAVYMPLYAAPPAPVQVDIEMLASTLKTAPLAPSDNQGRPRAPVVPPAIEPDYKVIKSILPTANPDEYACCIAADMWNACRADLLQANQRDLSQPVDPQVTKYEQIMLQAGWVMVPVEPTEEMIAAAMECEDVLFNSDGSFCVQFREIYCAMVDAALALNKGEY